MSQLAMQYLFLHGNLIISGVHVQSLFISISNHILLWSQVTLFVSHEMTVSNASHMYVSCNKCTSFHCYGPQLSYLTLRNANAQFLKAFFVFEICLILPHQIIPSSFTLYGLLLQIFRTQCNLMGNLAPKWCPSIVHKIIGNHSHQFGAVDVCICIQFKVDKL